VPVDHALLTRVRGALAAAADPARAARQQEYMKSALPYHGLGAPRLRAVLGPILADTGFDDRGTWEGTARELWDTATHREEWYAALALLRHRRHRGWQDPHLLPLLEHLVRSGAWWDVVDEIAGHLVGGVLAADRPRATPVLLAWAVDEDLWIRRAAVLAQLRHRADTDRDLLRSVLDANLRDSLHGREFFVRKALGWALRQYSTTDPQWVADYVGTRGDRLSGLTRREALKRLG
jgi:3-methyladenine DNA glycosylase AlkD